MEKIQQVQKRKLISLASIGSSLDIKEGDYVSIEVVDEGLLIKPVEWHEKSQEYFWQKDYQEKMKRARNDIEEGNYQKFESLSELADFIDQGMDNE